jgi:mannose-6-phosphate isomerase-like protein (cupin superfamily)
MSNPLQVVDSKNIDTPSYQWGPGCLAWVLSQTAGCTIKEEQMAPATREQLHLHKAATQFFYILEGAADMYVDSKIFCLRAGQGLEISPMSTHYIANNTENQLRFLVITTPGEPAKGDPNGNKDRENLPG